MVRKFAIFCIFTFIFRSVFAEDTRMQAPTFLDHSYLGFGYGLSESHYTNSNLPAGYVAERVRNGGGNYHFYAGHDFSNYFGIQADGLWTYPRPGFININHYSKSNNINRATIGFFLKPMLPIGQRFSINTLLGGGIISSRGFDLFGRTLLADQLSPALMLGGGFSYYLTPHWALDLSGIYAFAHAPHQPYFYTIDLGVHYLFLLDPSKKNSLGNSFYFPTNQINLGYYSRKITNLYVHRYFTPPYLPIFWKGIKRANQGFFASYQRNFYHSQKYFSLDWGVSMGTWTSSQFNNAIFTASIYPALKFWFFRSKDVDLYLTYSLAGPTYFSRRYVDNRDLGGEFTFQDFLGVGALFGQKKHINFDVKIIHYSNGYVLPQDPGFDVPIVFSLGLTW